MAKYCKKCGKQLNDYQRFCPNCGARVSNDNMSSTEKNNTLKVIIGILIAIIIVGAGAGFYYYHNTQKELADIKSSTQNANIVKQNTETVAAKKEPVQEKEVVEDDLTKANEILRSKGFMGNISAVSKIDDNGFVGYINDEGVAFVVYDKRDDVVATVDFNKNVLDLRNNKTGNIYNSLILTVRIKDDKAMKDSNMGYWEDGKHNFSVFTLYDVNENNEIVPGKLTSGEGKKPSHYQGYLQEQQNVNIINMVLTYSDSLREDMQARHIKY